MCSIKLQFTDTPAAMLNFQPRHPQRRFHANLGAFITPIISCGDTISSACAMQRHRVSPIAVEVFASGKRTDHIA